jgi:hypothetical protein
MNAKFLALTSLMAGCAVSGWSQSAMKAIPFSDDVKFLQKHTPVIVLSDAAKAAQVAVVPAYQGRVMTSTAGGSRGLSFGWVNRELIASGKFEPHINVFGGEDRFWLGPEGGQFSVFFAPGASFDLEHWFTPASIDTEPFKVVKQTRESVLFQRSLQLTNYSGTRFEVEVQREVRLLDGAKSLAALQASLEKGVKAVAYETVNTVKNAGRNAWSKETGLLSIWILGMFNAAPETTIVIPYVAGPQASLGPVVNDTYFGKVPADRLVVKDQAMFFAADANYRSKIGVSPQRAKPVLGSYDAASRVLTLVKFTLPAGNTDYVNSMWQLQDKPFGGDAVNSYNDGPSKPGAKQLGKFYELESSSPALALAAGAQATHVHQTLHLQGSEAQLDAVARQVLGVSLAEIAGALKR